MNTLDKIVQQILRYIPLTREQASLLYEQTSLSELMAAARTIRQHTFGMKFDLCTIVNAKSGQCGEDCRFCAQSSHYAASVDIYSILDETTILRLAKQDEQAGSKRFSLVTSGRQLNESTLNAMIRIVKRLKSETKLSICGSFGLLDRQAIRRLKMAGLSRLHNNLETSSKYFSSVCTTHTYADKIKTIQAAQAEGLAVCSGGLFGMGESVSDRLDLAFALRDLGVDSVPINILNPIAGTPFADRKPMTQDEIARLIAVYRLILPHVWIRLAGGRRLLLDHGRFCYDAGANAVISGDMLTTAGYTIQTDIELVQSMGFKLS